MFKWIKRYVGANIIRQFDELEEPFAQKIIEAQKKLGEIPPHQFAKEVVDEIQRWACRKLDIPVEKIGLKGE